MESSDAALDSLRVLLRQERHYVCTDYLQQEDCRSSASTEEELVHSLVEEMSNLVTDPSLCAERNPFRPRSPEVVKKSPSQDSFDDVRQTDLSTEDEDSLAIAALDHSFAYWRRHMFYWVSSVANGFGLARQVIPVSFNILDRYVALQNCSISRDDFQLYSMTCLYMATKILEPFPRKIGLDALLAMSRGCYTADDITETERDILNQLEWRVNPPTANSFCDLMWSLFPVEPTWQMISTSEHLAETTIADPFFLSCPPSLVGLAAVLFAASLHGVAEEVVLNFSFEKLHGFISCKNNAELNHIYSEMGKSYCQ